MTNLQVKRPVTMRDLAEAAGVHQSTVSRALRNDPLISEKARKSIQEIAKKLNYRPNPFVQAFTAQVRGYRRSPTHAAIAIIENQDVDYLNRYRVGATKRAEELGFKVEVLSLEKLGNSVSRLNDIIKARGIRGILLLPVPSDSSLVNLDFEYIAASTIDYSLKTPQLHRAAPNYFRNMQITLKHLGELGYRRIGFCTYKEEIERIGNHWLGAFKAWQTPQPVNKQLRIHFNPHSDKERAKQKDNPVKLAKNWEKDKDAFNNWLIKEKPDVVISNDYFFYEWIKELGYKIPQKIGFVTLNAYPELPHISGIDENHETIAASAIDLVLGQFHRNEYNIPAIHKTLLIDGKWNDSETTKKQSVRTKSVKN